MKDLIGNKLTLKELVLYKVNLLPFFIGIKEDEE